MAPKSVLEKEAWQWAESTKPRDISAENMRTAYRISLAGCPRGLCKRNCQGNPRCLNAMGEKTWLQEDGSEEEESMQCDMDDIRKDGELVGLKNLGATCYINSLLQVWFHTPEFRRAVLLWIDPSLDDDSVTPMMVDPPAAAEIEPQTAAEIEPSAEADIEPPATAEIERPAVAEIERPAVAEIERPAVAEIERPAVAEIERPATLNGCSSNGDESLNVVKSETEIKKTKTSDETSVSRMICAELQKVFALMMFSNRRYISPAGLISALRLDDQQQQDAQEFSKLFMALLESVLLPSPSSLSSPPLSSPRGSKVRSVIQEQFVGEYDYLTRCKTCGIESRRRSSFYELDLNIKDLTDLHQSILEFLQEEELSGDNQYMCPVCHAKMDAVRRIELHTLPVMLNLQLLRFVFDRKTLNKKKLTTYIQFPEVLDLSKFVVGRTAHASPESLVYELHSVLVHSGSSAHSGHYVALVKDARTGDIYRMNDRDVSHMSDGQFHLEDFEPSEKSSAGKKPAKKEGHLVSRSAYTLVYRRRGGNTDQATMEDVKVEELSVKLQDFILRENDDFETEISNQQVFNTMLQERDVSKRKEVRMLYRLSDDNTDSDADLEWISAKWLHYWMTSDSTEMREIDNTPLLCAHERMDPCKVDKAKLVSREVAQVLVDEYGANVRLCCDTSLCQDCVMIRCHLINKRLNIAREAKEVAGVLKATSGVGEEEAVGWFWVGKKSLKNWRRLAEMLLESGSEGVGEENEEPEGEGGTSEGGGSNGTSEGATTGNGNDTGSNGDNGSVDFIFNEDLKCEHGNLDPNESLRRLVPLDVWNILRQYFPGAEEIPVGFPICLQCRSQNDEEQEARLTYQMLAVEQKQQLISLFSGRNRPTWDNLSPGESTLWVITDTFFFEWLRYVRDPVKYSSPVNVSNALCVCAHKGVTFSVSSRGDLDRTLMYVTGEEWKILTAFIPFDHEITVTKVIDESGVTFTTFPALCTECCGTSGEVCGYEYTRGCIYVRKVTDMETLYQLMENGPASGRQTSDPEISNGTAQTGVKRKAVGPAPSPCPPASEKIARTDHGGVRRSERKKDQKPFTVASSDTLSNFKIRLAEEFHVMKSDQQLFFEGVELVEEKCSLGQCLIPAGATLYLLADDRECKTPPVPDAMEAGFKGSNLLGH